MHEVFLEDIAVGIDNLRRYIHCACVEMMVVVDKDVEDISYESPWYSGSDYNSAISGVTDLSVAVTRLTSRLVAKVELGPLLFTSVQMADNLGVHIH